MGVYYGLLCIMIGKSVNYHLMRKFIFKVQFKNA